MNDKKQTCGIVMAGGNGTRLYPLTKSVNKHLLPVYDKPMIFYPISTLMMAGIRRIAIVTRAIDRELYKDLLGDGSRFGVDLSFVTQDIARGVPDAYLVCEEFIKNDDVVLILGDNIFAGQGLGETLSEARNHSGAHIFAFPVTNPQDYGVITFDPITNRVTKIEEKPKNSKSRLAVPGLYFTDNRSIQLARQLTPSDRGETEISELLMEYLAEDSLTVSVFRRGIGWMDAGSIDALYAAGELISVLQRRQGLQFANLEEIAWRNGWINDAELQTAADFYPGTKHQSYLNGLLDE
jgi:glucose-1-phosphate thymidylyltransferase